MRSTPVLLLVLVVVLSCSLSSSARKLSGAEMLSSCDHTSFPGICTWGTNQIGKLRDAFNTESVLKKHLEAINHQSELASKMAEELMRNTKGNMEAALKHCVALYNAKGDMMGMTMRELYSKNEQWKQVMAVMLQLMRESVQECDLQFQQAHMSNPLASFNHAIFMLATNADDLTNMMT